MSMSGNAFQFMTILSFLIPLGMIIAWIILLVIAWRFMRAHESIAQTYKSLEVMIKELAGSIKPKE